jgi:hypothetical protein
MRTLLAMGRVVLLPGMILFIVPLPNSERHAFGPGIYVLELQPSITSGYLPP